MFYGHTKLLPERPQGKLPFTLCFGVNVVILIEIGNESLQGMAFDEQANDQLMRDHLTLIDEISAQATKKDKHTRNK